MSNGLIVPLMDPNRGWSVFNKPDIYTGSGTGRIVPNVNDLIVSYTEGFERVSSVDYTTGLSTLVPASGLVESSNSEIPLDTLLLSNDINSVAETFRLFVDGSVTPHTMDVENTIKVNGSDLRYMKVFKGTNIDNGVVVSRVYDSSGALLGENVPLEPIDPNNPSIKRPVVAYCSENLKSGDLVTVVFYNDVNSAVKVIRLLVKNTKWVRSVNASTVYITNIELTSPFLSTSELDTLDIPINIPTQAIDMRGVVNYSNGDRKVLNIDGTKFNVFGLSTFVSTILGQKQPISLIYNLSNNELAYDVSGGETPIVSKTYYARTTKVENAYTVKLYTYPVWMDVINGYRLVHFLYNLERNIAMDVTNFVELSSNSPAFNPTLYNTSQSLTLSLDLSKVDPRFKAYRHLQNTKVTLLRHGTEPLTKWTVGFDPVKPDFGLDLNANVEFINTNLWKLNLGNGLGSLEHWLRETYLKVLPLYDGTTESNPPTPNMFRVKIASYSMVFGMDMWDKEITINTSINAGDIVRLEFISRSQSTDLELAIVGLPVRMI